MNIVKLSLLLLALSGITAAQAVDIRNDTGYDIVLRIKNYYGTVTLVDEIQIPDHGYYDVGYLFNNQDFPYMMRIWFAQHYVGPENRENSQLVEWTPEPTMLQGEYHIASLKEAKRFSGNNNKLIILYNKERGFYLHPRLSSTFQYSAPCKHEDLLENIRKHQQKSGTEYANVGQQEGEAEYKLTPGEVRSESEYAASPIDIYRGSTGKQETETEYANMLRK